MGAHRPPLGGWKRSGAPLRVEALRRSPARGQPLGKAAAKDRKRSRKGHQKGGKGKPSKGKAKGGQEVKKEDRPAGEPDQQPKAKARKRPNKSRRRGGRSNDALLRRSEQGFLKKSGVYWLDVERSPRKQPTETLAAPNPKAVRPVEARDRSPEPAVSAEAEASSPDEPHEGEKADAAMGDAPLQEDLEPEGEAGRKAKAKKVPQA